MKFRNKTLKTMVKFTKPYKKYLILIIVFMVFTAIIDGFFPYMTKYAIDNFVIPQEYSRIKPFIIIYLLMIIFQGVNVFTFILLTGYIKNNICYDIRKRAFNKLQHLSFSYYDKTSSGWILARLTSDVEKMGEAVSWSLIDIVWGGSLIFFYIIIMLVINVRLALIAFIVLPGLIYITLYFQKKLLKYSRISRSINSKITSAVSEGIMGAKVTKTLAREESALNGFKELTSDMNIASVKVQKISSIYLPIVLSLGSIATASILWAGGNGVVAKTVTYGTLFAFMSYTMKFFEPIREVARVFADLQRQYASMERVMQLINEEITVKDYGDVILEELKGSIAFKNVNFKYETSGYIFKNFNLNIKAGETIAIVGETGSGKSTIVNLVCRFYEPTSGAIEIDGINYKELDLKKLQGSLGYVLQTPHLFNGTIRENISYGLDVSDKEVVEAAKLVNANSFIEHFEKGYETIVGEGGGMLSTGEKQLISFARAILANPKIFILDEATSSIDAKTEKLIQDAIEKTTKDRTSFIIAHRLSTIRKASRIIVLEKGKIIEGGTHDELIANKGYYHELYLKQFIESKEKVLDVI